MCSFKHSVTTPTEAASNDQISETGWNVRRTHSSCTERDKPIKSCVFGFPAWKITGQISTNPAPPPHEHRKWRKDRSVEDQLSQ